MKKILISSILLGLILMMGGCGEEGSGSGNTDKQQKNYLEQNGG